MYIVGKAIQPATITHTEVNHGILYANLRPGHDGTYYKIVRHNDDHIGAPANRDRFDENYPSN